MLSVRLSVRDVLVLDENGLTYCHSFSTIQYYQHHTFSRNSDTGGVEKIRDFLPISRYISQTIQNIAIVTMEGE